MDILILLGAVVGFIIAIVLANVFANIAEQKGAQRSTYFWLCFFLGWIGWIVVLALPDRGKTTTASYSSSAPSRVSSSGKIRRTGSSEYGKCEICGKDDITIENIIMCNEYNERGYQVRKNACSACIAKLENS